MRTAPRTSATTRRWTRPPAVLGAALVLAGSGTLGLSALQQHEGGFFTSSAATLATGTSALVTDEVAVEQGRPGNPSTDLGDLARVRIRAGATDAAPVFLGIGRTADVDAYLRGVAHDRMVGFALSPFSVRFDSTPGSAALAPGAQTFWVARATGLGMRSLLWDKEPGAWSAVAMNADGSPGVAVRADVGLRFAFLLPAGAALLTAGALLLSRVRSRRRPA